MHDTGWVLGLCACVLCVMAVQRPRVGRRDAAGADADIRPPRAAKNGVRFRRRSGCGRVAHDGRSVAQRPGRGGISAHERLHAGHTATRPLRMCNTNAAGVRCAWRLRETENGGRASGAFHMVVMRFVSPTAADGHCVMIQRFACCAPTWVACCRGSLRCSRRRVVALCMVNA